MRASLPWAVLLLALSVPALAERVESIPRPRPGTWSVDTTRKLLPVTLAQVDRLGAEADGSGDGQLAVVMVNTTEGVDPRGFATELFNAWGIGHADRDNGALLLIALDDRAAEIVLGDGVDGRDEQRLSDAVMQGRIVPAFKAGDPDGAVLAGAEGLRTLLSHSRSGVSFGAELSGYEPSGGFDVTRYSSWLLGLGLGGLGLVGMSVRRWLRNRPRVCGRCQQPRVRLNEVDDNRHLDKGQRREELLGSVDYDVWWCEECSHAQVESYGALFSGYERCRACRYKTARSSSSTRREATYDHGGEVEVTVTCEHCDHQHQFTRYTPRRTRSTTSSSSSSGSSGGFGGGSSSGGGSSGRW
jgi:uncharacterized protein